MYPLFEFFPSWTISAFLSLFLLCSFRPHIFILVLPPPSTSPPPWRPQLPSVRPLRPRLADERPGLRGGLGWAGSSSNSPKYGKHLTNYITLCFDVANLERPSENMLNIWAILKKAMTNWPVYWLFVKIWPEYFHRLFIYLFIYIYLINYIVDLVRWVFIMTGKVSCL